MTVVCYQVVLYYRISSNLSDTSNYPGHSWAIFVVLIQRTLQYFNITFVLNIRTIP